MDRIFPKPLRIGALLSTIAILAFGYSLFLIVLAHDLPDPHRLKEPNSPVTTEFTDRNGELLYRLYEGRNRTPLTLNDVSPHFINATVSIEDKNFFSHPGIDVFGITRAFISNLQNQNIQGGSTLTQQLIKNTLLTTERTWKRKVQEVLLSFWAERIYSKEQILTMYVNEAPYGGPNWGIDAAARSYFGKEAKDLNLAESAYLAGLPASPTIYSPYGPTSELGKERQKQVLRRMAEDGYITQAEADEAANRELAIKPPLHDLKAPHFVMYVRQLLEEKYGPKAVSQGGLRVQTTLDLQLQNTVQTIVSEEVNKLANLNVGNGAAMVTDPRTGHILAMVGSKDYYNPKFGNYNVTLAPRQPGSSIKPITYATGFKMGYSPGTVLLDTPTVFKSAWEVYAPVNYDGKFHGPVSIRTALGSSYNVPAVKMLATVGLPAMLQTARDLGITTLNDTDRYGLSLTLGAGEVKLLDMMTVYGTFSQMGVRHNLTPILKVTDSNGIVLEDNTLASGVSVLSPGIAYMITDILADNKARTPAFGPNSLLHIPGHTVPVKTGTTDNKKDNWAFGYTPEYVVGTWVGNNNNTPMNQALASGVTGASPIWNRIMTHLLKDKPDVAFVKPPEVVEGTTTPISFTDPFSTINLDQPGP
ncbi:MAG: hypothetical protein US86_C0007G0094 [Candidatus Daviesbacteria bacterium GW2011_GWA2_38_24]|uniref:Uncharacterized protein n=1 Tax=Candidatus Daviesbacteria bacterium GW2011_GWA2_38_24 TaxID=1618422 RepID=A0A0G0LXA2_9BACT|nr:MAG: hypothetical protein US86_C0007G0094 [Candidatus Daviesbacteria bacterium GW2011_GWA2_38_24]OGE22701.1 MAG: hypothetical protein A2688_02840 [Candidatus Daviesbacteria bacterium RIFCSPHIGHO2_01_FULL_38_8]